MTPYHLFFVPDLVETLLLIMLAPGNDPVIKRNVAPALLQFADFEGGRRLIGDVETAAVSFQREKNVVVVFCADRLHENRIQLDDSLPANELCLSKVLEPILGAFHGIKQPFPV